MTKAQLVDLARQLQGKVDKLESQVRDNGDAGAANGDSGAAGGGDGPHFQAIVESLPIPVIVASYAKGKIFFANSQAASLVGVTAPEMIERFTTEFFHYPEERARVVQSLAQSVPNRNQEITIRNLDGKDVHLLVSVHRIQYRGTDCLLSGFIDITHRKQAEEDLKANRLLLETIFDAIPTAVYVKGRDGKYLMANRAQEKIFGRPPEKLMGHTFEELGIGTKEEIQRALDSDRRVLENGERIEIPEDPITYPGGDVRWRHSTKVPLRDLQGEIIGLVGVRAEITERVRMERELSEHRQLLRTVFDMIPSQLFVKNLEGRYLMVNAEFSRRTGLGEAEALGNTLKALTILDDPFIALYQEQDREVLRSKKRREYAEVPVRYRDGREVVNRIIRIPLLNEEGEPTGILGMVENITDRVLAEERVRQNERIMRKAQQVAHLGSLEWDLVENRQFWSDEVFRIVGHPPQAFTPDDQKFAETLHPDDKKRVLEEMAAALTGDQPFETECRVLRPDGQVRVVAAQAEIDRDEDGRPLRMVGTLQDITERRNFEEELRKSEQRFRHLIEGSLQGIIIHRHGNPLFANRAFATAFGFESPEEVLRLKSLDSLLHPEDRPRLQGLQEARLRGEEVPTQYTFRGVRKDGTVIWLESMATLVDWEGEPASQSVNVEITERVRAEAALRESEQRFRSIVDYSPSAIILKDLEGRIILANKQFEAWYDITGDQAQGLRTDELYSMEIAQPDLDLDREVIRTREVVKKELEIPFANNTSHSVIVTKFPVIGPDGEMTGIGTINTDVTDLRRAEKMLMQAQRLESLGTLAGGIAHDLNNILVPVMGYAQVMLRHSNLDPETKSYLKVISNSAMRAKDLVSQILLFTRATEGRRDVCLLAPIVKEVAKLIASSLPPSIKIEEKISRSVTPVIADPSQIHQVIMNLCINAGHAMPNGGVLTLELDNVQVSGLRCYVGNLLTGPYVRLICEDTGAGMDADILDRIFEPFFTTKKKGEGTGLGLSTVFGIVGSHEGGIVVESRPGQGSRFEVYLPAIQLDMDEDPGEPEEIPRGSESILFVDDETSITDLGRVAMKKQGYRVTVQNNAVDALNLFRENPEAFDLLITDQSMPGMNGSQLIRAIREVRPELPIILCTGYSDEVTPEIARSLGVREFLYKPVDMEELWVLIRKVLDAAP